MSTSKGRLSTGASDGEEKPLSLKDRVRALIQRIGWRNLTGILLGLMLMVYGVYWLTREPEVPPAVRLQRALKSLDESGNRTISARRLAQGLRDIGYQDPDFAGGVAFVLGIASFREAKSDVEELDPESKELRFLTAVTELREAERLALVADRRPEWAFSLGYSLHNVGSAEEAILLLEEAVSTYSPEKTTASMLLAEAHLLSQSVDGAKRALELNTELLQDESIKPEERNKANLQRVQILLRLDRRAEAEQALAELPGDASGDLALVVLRAQTDMEEGKYQQASDNLKELASGKSFERVYSGQASYLMGVCAEKLADQNAEKIRVFREQNPGEPEGDAVRLSRDAMLGYLREAINFYETTLERFERTHEAVAAQLGLAEVFRKAGRHEESLEFYAAVLRPIRRPNSFRNRWISVKRLREIVVTAWNGWVEQGKYQEAIDLANMMSPAIPLDESRELTARANQRWAESLEVEISKLSIEKRVDRLEELKLRWKESGAAYSRLATTLGSSGAYHEALWTSAEDFVKGHEFAGAVEQYTKFIETKATTLIPTAMVRRGTALMDLDRFDEAIRDYETTVTNYPTDPAAFQARYLIGQCYFEQGNLLQAERAWRKILESSDLAPNALEWRRALYSLGKSLYHSADLSLRRIRREQPTGRTNEQQDLLIAGYQQLDDAVIRLEEYLNRYPAGAETHEVRFLLAKSLQKSAEYPAEKLRSAETDNAKAQYRKQVQERLDRALVEFQQLQVELAAIQGTGRLDLVGQMLMRNCYIDMAFCYFSLERFEEAITAYGNSAARYQQDPDSLTAYMQIANCYDRLQKPSEALSTLAQAKLILKQLPDDSFPKTAGGMRRDDWEQWLDWAMRLHK